MPDEHTIADNLQRLKDAKTAIGDAIESKGEPVHGGLENFASYINAIPESTLVTKTITANGTYDPSDDDADGYSSVTANVPNTYAAGDEGKVVSSGALVAQTAMSAPITRNGTVDTTLHNSVTVNVPSVEVKPVRFYDYDGTLVYSYTPEEFAALESLPENPTHAGLTAQGWNWTLADAKAFVENNSRIDIGQMYVTDDGRTRFYITLDEYRKSPQFQLYLAKQSTVDVDWGDGSEHSTLTNSKSTTTNVSARHEYATAGDYVISVKVTSGSAFLQGATTSDSPISMIVSNGNWNNASPDNYYAKSIKKVEIGSDFTTISMYAFYRCRDLKTITIPNTVTNIDQYAFHSCYNLKHVTLPKDFITLSGTYIFAYCYGLKTVSLSNSLTTISSYNFYQCNSLDSIVLPNSLVTIGNNAFSTCTALNEIVFGKGITTISGSSVFTGCNDLKTITFPDGFTTIGDSAFSSCYTLETVNLPSSLTEIKFNAFAECRSLKNITLPNNITLGYQAFQNCESLTDCNFPANITLGTNVYNGCRAITKCIVPEGVTSISGGLCNNCSSMYYIEIPSTCTSIGNDAFYSYATQLVRFKSLVPPTLGNSNAVYTSASTKILVPYAAYDAYMRPKTYYPDSTTRTYLAYATYESGQSLPTSSDDGTYSYAWYASMDDAVAGTNPITEGNGNEVYAVGTQYKISIIVDFTNNEMVQIGNPFALSNFSSIIRCNVDDDGTITKRVGESGYSNTGSKGQVMSYIPKFYYKMTPITLDGNHIRKAKWEIAPNKLDNSFKLHPAFIDVNGNEIDYFLFGTFEANGQNGSGTYNATYNTTDYRLSSAGTSSPSTSYTRTTARTMASNRGTGWHVAAIKQIAAIQMLMGVEFGFNSQSAIGNGPVNLSSIRAIAYTSNDGISSGGSTNLTAGDFYRGIENIWGNTNDMIEGMNTNGTSVYICDDYNFADDTDTGYTALSFTMPTSGYITAFGYDANYDWILIPSESSNDDNRSGPIGDYVDTPVAAGWTVPVYGGAFNYGSANAYQAGAFNYITTNDLATTANNIGARLMYVPTANV